MKFRRSPVLAPTFPPWRVRLVIALAAIAVGVLAGRAVYLQGWNRDFLQAKGESRYSRTLEIPAVRGRVFDRNGEALAVSTPVKSIWAIPEDAAVAGRDLDRLGAALGMPREELRVKLADTGRDFVYLKRQVPPAAAERVAALRLPGIHQSKEYRRYYPAGEAMAHMLGFTDVDDVGREGIELAYQEHLAGRAGSRRVIKDRLGEVVEDGVSLRQAKDGRDLVLALDSRIQNLAYGELRRAVESHRAKGGGIVVLDAGTGEVLALANLPSYNPNNRAQLAGAGVRNRAVTDAFEPGSTLKPFTIALALDTGRVAAATTIAVAPGSLTIGPAVIRDAHPEKALTVEQVIQKSSNVGAAKIALELPRESMWGLFDDVGFGAAPQLGLPGEAIGKLRPYKTWRPVEQATMSYGHGISVSLVQLARAYTVFARDGDLVPLSLVKVDMPPPGRPVFSKRTADTVRRMLELAAQPGGTAPRARIMGYRVAGKTGTAHKQANGAYVADKYRASFVGFAPASRPRLVIAVMLDEPSAGQHYGGVVAAPVFANVMAGALRILGVAPDGPMQPIEAAPPALEVRESV
ncbi:MAG TPA: penicillin-binding protein 2 [Burkholderiales bacterium]|nr:penicillin-binding protein 2 [Burkholderiales bacterium]